MRRFRFGFGLGIFLLVSICPGIAKDLAIYNLTAFQIQKLELVTDNMSEIICTVKTPIALNVAATCSTPTKLPEKTKVRIWIPNCFYYERKGVLAFPVMDSEREASAQPLTAYCVLPNSKLLSYYSYPEYVAVEFFAYSHDAKLMISMLEQKPPEQIDGSQNLDYPSGEGGDF